MIKNEYLLKCVICDSGSTKNYNDANKICQMVFSISSFFGNKQKKSTNGKLNIF